MPSVLEVSFLHVAPGTEGETDVEEHRLWTWTVSGSNPAMLFQLGDLGQISCPLWAHLPFCKIAGRLANAVELLRAFRDRTLVQCSRRGSVQGRADLMAVCHPAQSLLHPERVAHWFFSAACFWLDLVREQGLLTCGSDVWKGRGWRSG